jgi:hypothetical protein
MATDLYGMVRGWVRKAESWNAPVAPAPSAEAQAIIDALPVHRVNTPWPTADLPFEAPQYFVAVLPDGRRFLVDTEGGNYCRYIIRLPEVI